MIPILYVYITKRPIGRAQQVGDGICLPIVSQVNRVVEGDIWRRWRVKHRVRAAYTVETGLGILILPGPVGAIDL